MICARGKGEQTMNTDTSILLSIKKLLGIPQEQTNFDVDIIIHINTIIANLAQMGIGPSDGYSLTGEDETWEDYIGDNKLISQIRTYIYIKVRLVFDPPTNTALTQSFNEQAKELEVRMYTQQGGF